MAGVLVVTGGGKGIGAAVARQGGAAGYKVAVNYNSSGAAAEKVVRDIAAAGGTAIAVQADVSRSDEATRLFAEVDERLGTVTALCNNAGIIGAATRVDDFEPKVLESLFATNVLSYFYCAREAIRRMSTLHGGRGGAIVNISSAAAKHGGLPGEVPYASSKGAIDAMTIGLAKEVGREGVRVVSLRPGLIATDIHAQHQGGMGVLDTLAPTVPIGRAGEADEVAAMVIFLLSDAASYVTGTIVEVSGGR
jgi:NAD(P)-dependent dehydrogenase (short-subunit alcohol dehydrogenase family)